MRKVKKLDFVLYDDDFKTLIFRFRPRQSSCHSFGDEPPKSWAGVYKVYYSYSVLIKWKHDGSYEIVFDCSCDECSEIDEVARRCQYLADGIEQVEVSHPSFGVRTIELLNDPIVPMGMGVSWEIKKLYHKYEFDLFNWGGVGFRFCLTKEKTKEFGKYLSECCEYMLAHGDPI